MSALIFKNSNEIGWAYPRHGPKSTPLTKWIGAEIWELLLSLSLEIVHDPLCNVMV